MNAESEARGKAIIEGMKELNKPKLLDAPDSQGYWWMWEPYELGMQLAYIHLQPDGLRVFFFAGYENGQFPHEWPDTKWQKANIEIPEPPV